MTSRKTAERLRVSEKTVRRLVERGLPALRVGSRIRVDRSELAEDVKHTATNRVRDPSGDVLSEVTAEFAIGAEAVRPDWLTGFILPTIVEFEATEKGAYAIEHDVDDATKSLPMHVVHGLPPGVEPPDDAP